MDGSSSRRGVGTAGRFLFVAGASVAALTVRSIARTAWCLVGDREM